MSQRHSVATVTQFPYSTYLLQRHSPMWLAPTHLNGKGLIVTPYEVQQAM